MDKICLDDLYGFLLGIGSEMVANLGILQLVKLTLGELIGPDGNFEE